MLTPDEHAAWDAYVAAKKAQGVETDLPALLHVLSRLPDSAPGRIIADAIGLGTLPLPDLAIRLTLQAMRLIPTGHVPD